MSKITDLTYNDYSEKSIVVRGDIKKYEAELTKLNGLFNDNLKGTPGVIFPKTRLAVIKNFIENGSVSTQYYNRTQTPPSSTTTSSIDKTLALILKKLENIEKQLGMTTIDSDVESDTDVKATKPRKRFL